jgi:hypothetical protein
MDDAHHWPGVLSPADSGGEGPLLLFGFCDYAPHLCARDMEANPPVIQVRWEENAYPHYTTI